MTYSLPCPECGIPLTVEVDPGERTVYYERDGSGYPGSPPCAWAEGCMHAEGLGSEELLAMMAERCEAREGDPSASPGWWRRGIGRMLPCL